MMSFLAFRVSRAGVFAGAAASPKDKSQKHGVPPVSHYRKDIIAPSLFGSSLNFSVSPLKILIQPVGAPKSGRKV